MTYRARCEGRRVRTTWRTERRWDKYRRARRQEDEARRRYSDALMREHRTAVAKAIEAVFEFPPGVKMRFVDAHERACDAVDALIEQRLVTPQGKT